MLDDAMKSQNDPNAAIVRNLAFARLPKAYIAEVIGVSITELEERYGDILKSEPGRTLALIISSFKKAALQGNITAQIFCMKALCHWQDAHYSSQGTPPQFPVIGIPPRAASKKDWLELYQKDEE